MTEQLALLYSLCAVAMLVESVARQGKAKAWLYCGGLFFLTQALNARPAAYMTLPFLVLAYMRIVPRQPQGTRQNGCSQCGSCDHIITLAQHHIPQGRWHHGLLPTLVLHLWSAKWRDLAGRPKTFSRAMQNKAERLHRPTGKDDFPALTRSLAARSCARISLIKRGVFVRDETSSWKARKRMVARDALSLVEEHSVSFCLIQKCLPFGLQNLLVGAQFSGLRSPCSSYSEADASPRSSRDIKR